MKRDENQNVEYKESWHDKYLEWICGYANAKGGTLYIGKMLDAYSLPLANPHDRKPTFVSDTFFRVVLPNLTYGLTKEELVSFAERQSTSNSRTPQVVPHKSHPPSQPHKSHTSSRWRTPTR